MKLENAIKKLSRHTEVKNSGALYWGVIGNNVVEFMRNGRIEDDRGITCIKVRGIKDHNDSMTDYSAGVWYNTLTSAINSALRR